jgi:hypothetical protein
MAAQGSEGGCPAARRLKADIQVLGVAFSGEREVLAGRQDLIFTVLVHEEAQEIAIHVDWDAHVALTPEMLEDKNCLNPSSIARSGLTSWRAARRWA